MEIIGPIQTSREDPTQNTLLFGETKRRPPMANIGGSILRGGRGTTCAGVRIWPPNQKYHCSLTNYWYPSLPYILPLLHRAPTAGSRRR